MAGQKIKDEWRTWIGYAGLTAAGIVIILGIAMIVAWNGQNDRLSKERIGRDCIAAGGTWTHGDCINRGS